MIAAVFEFGDFERNALCRFADLLVGNVVDFGVRFLIFNNFFFDRACDVGIVTQPIVDRELRFFHDRRAHFDVAELVFRLARKHGIVDADLERDEKSPRRIAYVVFFFIKGADTLRKAVEKGRYVGAAVFGALPVYERINEFVEAVRMREDELNRFAVIRKHRIERLALSHFV